MEAEREDQARMVNAERQRECRQGAGQDTQPQGPALKRACRREEHFIPNCNEEMQEWMEDRHKDLQVALAAGQLAEVARVSNLLTQAAQKWQQMIVDKSIKVSMPSAVPIV